MNTAISSLSGVAAVALVATAAMAQQASTQVGLSAEAGAASAAAPTANVEPLPPAIAEPEHAAAAKAEGLEIRAGENVFLKFSGIAQLRYNLISRSSHLNNAGESVDYSKRVYHGLSIPRARLFFDGGLAKWLTFRARLGLKDVNYVTGVTQDAESGELTTATSSAPTAVFEQVYVDLKAKGRGASYKLRVGVHKPHLYELDSMSGERVELIDYSTAAAFFAQGDINNFEGSAETSSMRVFLSLHNGVRESYGNAFAGIEGTADVAEIGGLSRFEVHLGGSDWKRWEHQASWKGNKTAVKIGVAGNYQRGKDEAQAVTNRWDGTLDVRAAGDGWNVLGAFMSYRASADPLGGPKASQLFYGFQVQGGYFVAEPIEVAARFANTTLAKETVGGQAAENNGAALKARMFNELAAGANYYVFPKKYTRLQADFVYYPQGTQSGDASRYASPITKADPNRGLLVGDAASWAVRTQFTVAW